MVHELTIDVPSPEGNIPLLAVHPACTGRFRGTVLLYHGLMANKEGNRGELVSLAERGFLAIGVDAVAHGHRRDPDLERRKDGLGGHAQIMRWVQRSAAEVPRILDALTALIGPATGRFGITGISMGGFITYAAARVEPRLAAFVPILGTPDWTPPARGGAGRPPTPPESPHLHTDAFSPRPLLALNAGLDDNVPPAGSRELVARLRPLYAAHPERLEYVEYPESAHFMRESDWHDLWARAVRWFERWLPA